MNVFSCQSILAVLLSLFISHTVTGNLRAEEQRPSAESPQDEVSDNSSSPESVDEPADDGWRPSNREVMSSESAVAADREMTAVPYNESSAVGSADVPAIDAPSASEFQSPSPADPADEGLSQGGDSEASTAEVFDGLLGLNESSWSWVLGGDDRIGFLSLESGPSMELEFDGPEQFEIETGTGIHFLDGPGRTDLPPRLFDLYFNVHMLQKIDCDLGYDLSFSAGVYTDFEDSAREGVRFPGRALLFHDTSASTRLMAGIEYLDRDNIQILPAGGLLVRPDDETRLELYFPRPSVRVRVKQTEKKDEWVYVSGEYHGGSWAIERVTGNADVVTLNEFRLTVGFETLSKKDDGDASFCEFAYLFGRDLEYRSHVGDYKPQDTVMFRLGRRY